MGFRVPAVAVSPVRAPRQEALALGARPRRLGRPATSTSTTASTGTSRSSSSSRTASGSATSTSACSSRTTSAAASSGSDRTSRCPSCRTRRRSSPSRARSGGGDVLDSQEAHASDLAEHRDGRRALQAAGLRGQDGPDLHAAGLDQEGASRPRRSDGRVRLHGDETADPRRAGRGRGAGARGREPGHRGDGRGGRRRRRRSSWTPRSRAPARPRAAGRRRRRSSAPSCCTRWPRACAALTDDLARALTLEGGKPLIENSDEVGWTAAAFDYYAEMGRNFAGRVIPSIEATQLALVIKEPTGVWGAIVPWNYPLLLLSWKLAPALAAGNTVVAKPSELTPRVDADAGRVLRRPAAGRGQPRRRARATWARRWSRTRASTAWRSPGSVATGKKVAAACAERVARMNLEMGGKDPFIVCADVAADVEVAASGGAWAAYLNAGQVCTSAERFYVQREVYDDFLDAFVAHARELRVGDPLDDDDRRRADGVGAAARQGGGAGRGRGGGRRRAGRGRRPRRPRARPLLRARRGHRRAGVDRPAARGDVRPGGADRAGRRRSTRRSSWPTPPRSGWARTSTRATSRPPCAACARSAPARSGSTTRSPTTTPARSAASSSPGFGRELGQEGLEAFQETKHVHIETKIAPKEWWYPYAPGG